MGNAEIANASLMMTIITIGKEAKQLDDRLRANSTSQKAPGDSSDIEGNVDSSDRGEDNFLVTAGSGCWNYWHLQHAQSNWTGLIILNPNFLWNFKGVESIESKRQHQASDVIGDFWIHCPLHETGLVTELMIEILMHELQQLEIDITKTELLPPFEMKPEKLAVVKVQCFLLSQS
jgi:hypothetical protein